MLSRVKTIYPLTRGETIMRKIIAAILISAALIVSGLSTTTFSSGQLTSSAWAEGGA
jgi:ABC-type transport system involved in multi-copper enzyme maturation permease subunit